MSELQEEAVEHLGASNAAPTATLYDVEAMDFREFGDARVKLAVEHGFVREGLAEQVASLACSSVEDTNIERDPRSFESGENSARQIGAWSGSLQLGTDSYAAECQA